MVTLPQRRNSAKSSSLGYRDISYMVVEIFANIVSLQKGGSAPNFVREVLHRSGMVAMIFLIFTCIIL